MTQLNQALEVVKDIAQIKARLIKNRMELKAILDSAQDKHSDGTITPTQWHALNYIRHRIDELLIAFDKFQAGK